ncbi:hypothetical protein ASPWEDRAFT_36001 [Aspergillus wentii DTO 134E9]|uniref:Uncharacterized protein n=1 Tax=Aspergillus wentii DTO 134E9 TaxID=1073089 RepID=A0A1L9RU99_ASPWE|nr:uncharacterized protein ASPWEDRAFT_36001 [Aspergillus wentii DTO 134E9]KAI9934022.1 hypothetical protein MW887_005095 [Aspergillus wentii]OJJ38387.1 hypothetical protein ASPWEDRAFT_36001 [Aspergillus wentii DTO 134E9]
MASGFLRPLAVFCSQSQSQRYIKTIKNLGDAWRSLAEIPLPECDKNSALIETNFDFVLKITNALEEQRQPNPTIVEMSTTTSPPPTSQPALTEPPWHYRIFADYGVDFIWRDLGDFRPEEGDAVVEPEEVLSSFPPSVLESYDAWVDTYTANFKERREKTGKFHATIFPTASEEVAWNVAGFLLAWRIVMAPQVGRIEYTAGCSQYFLEKGKETSVTLAFLQDRVDILAKGPS